MTVHVPRNNAQVPVAFRPAEAVVKAEGDPMEARPMLVASLRRLLSDVLSFSLRAHGFHWNVIGPDFVEYHSLFGSIYEDAESSVDPIAEAIRTLDGMAPFRLPEIMALRSIVDVAVSAPMPAEMTADLHAGNESVLSSLQMAFEVAAAANEQGIANLLSERIEAHQRHAWMLKASLAS